MSSLGRFCGTFDADGSYLNREFKLLANDVITDVGMSARASSSSSESDSIMIGGSED
jgi:hypothetical protein